MEQAQTESGGGGGDVGGSQGRVASWGAWEAYYREASRRRHARGGLSSMRRETRRRRARERLVFIVTAAFVSVMIFSFYLFLNH
jgi:hypothetical protein